MRSQQRSWAACTIRQWTSLVTASELGLAPALLRGPRARSVKVEAAGSAGDAVVSESQLSRTSPTQDTFRSGDSSIQGFATTTEGNAGTRTHQRGSARPVANIAPLAPPLRCRRRAPLTLRRTWSTAAPGAGRHRGTSRARPGPASARSARTPVATRTSCPSSATTATSEQRRPDLELDLVTPPRPTHEKD